MSLINEALKKAQRARTTESAEAAPIPGGRVTKRAQPRTAQQLVLIAAGGIVLVVLSVVVTVYLVNREPEAKPAAPAAKSATPTSAGTAPASGVVVPALNPSSPASAPSGATGAAPTTTTAPSSGQPVAAAPGQVAPAPQSPTSAPAAGISVPGITQTPAGNPASSTVAVPTITPAATSPSASTPPAQAPAPAPIVVVPTPSTANAATAAALVPPKPDERVAQYVDTIRVAAIRATEGRVLMNDRVYKINDIVERGWGLRLTKVEPGVLTFTDANGAVYVKTL